MLSNSAKKIDIKQLNSECLAFRTAILKLDKDKLSEDLKDFPRGSCGCCNDLLLHHFNKINFPNIQNFYYVNTEEINFPNIQNSYYVHTGMDKNWTHAWLEVDSIIIDITISQFYFFKGLKKVIFDNDKWHKLFNGKSRTAYCLLEPLEEDNYTDLISNYSEIMKNFEVL